MAKVVEERKSDFSGVIRVVKEMSGVRLVAGELDQSGGAVVAVLRKVLEVVDGIEKGLILGMAGGTMVRLIRKRFPKARLTCVEIDPVMVELARKYFGMTEDESLQIICEDAAVWVKNQELRIENKGGGDRNAEFRSQKLGEHDSGKPHPNPLLRGEGKRVGSSNLFDFILVDCYLGGEVPKQCETEEFLTGVRNLLTDEGTAVFNRLFYDTSTRRRAQEFIFKLEPVFPKIDLRRAGSNLLIVCRRI